ncbi:MAG: hypothetical protein RIQ60_919 [Pseudomonadota bacterium]
MKPERQRVAVVGGGWAGLAAAVHATESGHAVELFEMALQSGGRARSLAALDEAPGLRLDNGQHILIGAYTATLDLMRRVGVDPEAVLLRRPLELLDARGQGLRLPRGPALFAFSLGVWRMRQWSPGERGALVQAALGWLLQRFRCAPDLTVAKLVAHLPARVRQQFIDPLCVAALNTPAEVASAEVFLRVLHDALFAGPGSSDLLIPRRPLAELLPEPALHWLSTRNVPVHLGRRVQGLERRGSTGWRVDGQEFDQVVLACSAAEAARLTLIHAPAWSTQAAAFGYEPIITVYLQADGARLAAPMVALSDGPDAPAQFAFDHGALGATAGVFALVVSGASPWVARGLAATESAVLAQAHHTLLELAPGAMRVLRVVAEKRATFRCVPGLGRPTSRIAPGLLAAGDHVHGPYPATLEGAVRSGRQAAAQLQP